MPVQVWYRVKDIYEQLGHPNPESLRRWIRTGLKQRWLKIGVHIKPSVPKAKRPTWLVNFEKCNAIGNKK